MSDLILVSDNNLFGQSLRAFLEVELGNNHVHLAHSVLDIEVNKYKVSLIIYELADIHELSAVLHFQLANPTVKILVIHPYIAIEEYKKLINSGIKGSILKSAHLAELIEAVKEIESGKISFPQHVLQEILFQKRGNSFKSLNLLSDREIEILKMLCDGFTNEQISEKLHLSYDTVKWHRSNIFIKCESKNILALYKFALKHNLVQPTI